jgi:hypothetical protein
LQFRTFTGVTAFIPEAHRECDPTQFNASLTERYGQFSLLQECLFKKEEDVLFHKLGLLFWPL